MLSPDTSVPLSSFFNFHKFHLKTFQVIKRHRVFPSTCFSCAGGEASEIERGLTWDTKTLEPGTQE